MVLRYKLNYTAESGLPISGIGACANKIRLVGPAGVRGYRFPRHRLGSRAKDNLTSATSDPESIQPRYAAIQYVSFDEIVGSILKAGRGCCILKWDIKDAFRNIPVAPSQHWLLGFQWQGHFYHETVLSFGLRTAPVLFNLFAEGFHWILLKAGFRFLHHYLDDFVAMVPREFPPQPYEHTFLRS